MRVAFVLLGLGLLGIPVLYFGEAPICHDTMPLGCRWFWWAESVISCCIFGAFNELVADQNLAKVRPNEQ